MISIARVVSTNNRDLFLRVQSAVDLFFFYNALFLGKHVLITKSPKSYYRFHQSATNWYGSINEFAPKLYKYSSNAVADWKLLASLAQSAELKKLVEQESAWHQFMCLIFGDTYSRRHVFITGVTQAIVARKARTILLGTLYLMSPALSQRLYFIWYNMIRARILDS